MMGETPSSAMFGDLRRFCGIAHRDAARLLLNRTALYGGKSLQQRIDDKTFLSLARLSMRSPSPCRTSSSPTLPPARKPSPPAP